MMESLSLCEHRIFTSFDTRFWKKFLMIDILGADGFANYHFQNTYPRTYIRVITHVGSGVPIRIYQRRLEWILVLSIG